MLASFSEFKFFQSFRIPVEKGDDLRFLVQFDESYNKSEYVEDATLVDISVTGLGFSTKSRLSVGSDLTISLNFRKHQIELSGIVVRSFSQSVDDEEIIYGVELDEDKKLSKFLQAYIMSFSPERLKECLIQSALKEKYTKASDGFEMFSLLLSLFKDITNFGNKEGFLDNMVEEVVRILNATRASIFLINPDSNELEAISAMGVEKDSLKFDYRLGIAGSVFTTGVALNIDISQDRSRFNNAFDKKLGFETRSIICYPIQNREEKIIGVIEVLNKKNDDRFNVEDEKTMKVMALVFSCVFHDYNPMSEKSQIRRFSAPSDRKHVIIGRTSHISHLRNTIIKMKDLDEPVLVSGESGVGKTLYSIILHEEGKRGLNRCEIVNCGDKDIETLQMKLFSINEEENVFLKSRGGTVVLKNIEKLSDAFQSKLFKQLTNSRVEGAVYTFDARTIGTTSVDLGEEVDEGNYHSELFEMFYRAYVHIEPLRRRQDDVPLLVDYFLKAECKREGLLLKSFSEKAMQNLMNYDWPLNIKELKRCVERAVLYNPKTHVITEVEMENSAAPLLDTDVKKRIFGDLPFVSDFNVALKDRLAIVEREMIIGEIKRNNGNKSKAAKEMGISREALRKKLLYSQEILDSLSNTNNEPKVATLTLINGQKKAA
ncbi:MAG: sigma 54-interacting transcriptional regulator [Halobacteriovoraceae bacterium]|nr:sigma 54-interacting transcriptional regulator [Halobacteriovoraceae bacterium]